MSTSKKIDLLLNVWAIPQANSKCCWLACHQMLYEYRHGLGSRSEATTKLRNAGLSTDSALYSDQWKKARNALGLSSLRATALDDLDLVEWYLVSSGPIWSAGDFGSSDSGHAVLVSGIYYSNSTLRIHDPWVLATRGETESMGHKRWYKLVSKNSYSCQLWW